MLAVLEFAFRSFWTWLGAYCFLLAAAWAVASFRLVNFKVVHCHDPAEHEDEEKGGA